MTTNQKIKTLKTIVFFTILLSFTQCKTQKMPKEAPFTISEKVWFKWAGGKKGNQGTTIKIVGSFETTNLDFSNIYFQNYTYKVVPELRGDTFTLIGSRSNLKEELIMSGNSLDEYGNKPPKLDADFPFELQMNEAVIEYSINQQTYFYKITGVKQLKTIFYP